MSYNYDQGWKKPVMRAGIVTLLMAAITSFFPALYLALGLGIIPELTDVLRAWGIVLSIFGALYIIEPITYYSALGLSGSYLSFLSGNIGNMRVPCSIMAMEATNTEPGTKRAEIISTLGISGSIIANMALLSMMAFAGAKIIDVLPATLIDGFRSYTIPAIYGAMFAQIAIKCPRLTPFGFAIPVVLLYSGIPNYIVILISVISLIAIARIFYIKDKKIAEHEVRHSHS